MLTVSNCVEYEQIRKHTYISEWFKHNIVRCVHTTANLMRSTFLFIPFIYSDFQLCTVFFLASSSIPSMVNLAINSIRNLHVFKMWLRTSRKKARCTTKIKWMVCHAYSATFVYTWFLKQSINEDDRSNKQKSLAIC